MVSPSISVLQHTGRLEGVFGGLLPADLSVSVLSAGLPGLPCMLSCPVKTFSPWPKNPWWPRMGLPPDPA
jgi:hypothetical protein